MLHLGWGCVPSWPSCKGTFALQFYENLSKSFEKYFNLPTCRQRFHTFIYLSSLTDTAQVLFVGDVVTAA